MFVHGTVVSIGILVFSIFLIIFSYKFTLLVSKKFDLTNILFLFMVYYIVFAYIGSVVLNVWYTKPGMGYLVYQRKDILLKIWAFTSLGLVVIPMSVYLYTNCRCVPCKINVSGYKSLLPMDQGLSFASKEILICFFVISLYVLYMYASKLNGLPLLVWLQNTSLSQSFLRSEGTNNFQGHLWRYRLFYETIPTAVYIIVMFHKKNRIFKIVLFLYICFISVMTFQKGPLLNFLILNLLIQIKKRRRISIKTLLLLFFVFCFLMVIMYKMFMNASGSVLEILKGAAGRVFLSQIIPFYWYFQYAEINGFLLGTSFPNPAAVLPFEHTRITVEVMNLYRQSADINTNVIGSMPTVFMADWYVNFGVIGVLVSLIIFPILVSVILISISDMYRTFPTKKGIVSALQIYLVFYFTKYSGTSFTGIIIDMDLIITVLIFLFILIFEKQRKKSFSTI